MKFAIIKQNFEKGQKKLVGYTNSIEDFEQTLKKEYIDTKIIDSINITNLESNNNFNPSKYILVENNIYQLVEKYICISGGYIYNSSYPKTKILCQWELVNCEYIDNNYQQMKLQLHHYFLIFL